MKRKTAFGIDAGFFPFRDFLCPTHVFLRFYFEIHSTYTIFVGKLETPMNKISDLTHIHVKLKKQGLKDLVFICLGILLYSFGYTAFILPDQIVMGGASGIAALLYYGFKIPPAISIWSIRTSGPDRFRRSWVKTASPQREGMMPARLYGKRPNASG